MAARGSHPNELDAAERNAISAGTYGKEPLNDASHVRNRPQTPTKAERYASGGGGLIRDELYAEARCRDIKGRSTMTKAQLQRALRDR
jgi:hypothetical protein